MDPVTIIATLGAVAAVGTQVSKVKTNLWDPIIWPVAKVSLYLVLAAAIVSVVQTNFRLMAANGS